MRSRIPNFNDFRYLALIYYIYFVIALAIAIVFEILIYQDFGNLKCWIIEILWIRRFVFRHLHVQNRLDLPM